MEIAKKYTLKDVARNAGVSVGTVSHYLNNPKSVKETNRVVLERVIKEMGFVPNFSARSLASGKSKNVVLFVLSERIISPTTWLHQLPIIQTIHNCLDAVGYSLQMCIVYEEDYDEFLLKVRRCVESRSADGIIILSVWKIRNDVIDYLSERSFPLVCADNENERGDIPYICFDNYGAMAEIVRDLYQKAIRKIVYIDVRTHQQDMALRYRGFSDTARTLGLQIEQQKVLFGDFSIESGYRCMKEFLSSIENINECFSAVIGGNDNMAVGASQALIEHGLRIPEDIMVVGIDNSIAAKASMLQLQNVEFDLVKLAERTVSKLCALMNGEDVERGIERIGYRMIR